MNTPFTRDPHLLTFRTRSPATAVRRKHEASIDKVITDSRVGNGIAIGSLGQYLTDASVANIVIDHATIIPGGAQGYIGNAAYIKTWVGELVSGGDRDYESDYRKKNPSKRADQTLLQSLTTTTRAPWRRLGPRNQHLVQQLQRPRRQSRRQHHAG